LRTRRLVTAVALSCVLASVSACGGGDDRQSDSEQVTSTSTSASATPVATYVLFKNGDVYCTAFKWTRPDGFVGCSARIGGDWRSAFLTGSERAFESNQAVAPTRRYQQLRTRWKGGPYLCTAARDAVVCSSGVHGFVISPGGITTK
jgi:hypothetical protein